LRAEQIEANLAYVGSITIDRELIERVGLWIGEKVLVVSNTSGVRLETYIIEGERGSGAICINGAAAHLIKAGESIIVMGFELSDVPIEPRLSSSIARTVSCGTWVSKPLWLTESFVCAPTTFQNARLS
jgi:aspartate 1-decarboxylase